MQFVAGEKQQSLNILFIKSRIFVISLTALKLIF